MVATGLAVEMSFVAIGWQVYSIHSNPLDLGLIGLAMFIPLPLLALPAGHLADRFPRRTMLALATALDTAVMLGLLAVTRAGAEQTWPFYLLAFATGVASALGAPASRAMTPTLVPSSILVRALAIRSIGFQVSVIVGPAIGGLLFSIHSELVYAIAAALSIVSLLMVLLLRAGQGAGRGVVAGPRERARRRPARPSHAGAARCDLARSLRGAVRRSRRPAARLREGRAARRSGRARPAPGRAGRRRALLGDRPLPAARYSAMPAGPC